jgi:MSHA biogenesis protein MshN
MDSPELEIRNLQQALAFGQHTEMLLEKIGTTQVNLGKLKDAEETFQKLINRYPDNATAINELAFIAFNQGDLKKAEMLLRRGLKRHPDNPDFKANYERITEAMRQSLGGKR